MVYLDQTLHTYLFKHCPVTGRKSCHLSQLLTDGWTTDGRTTDEDRSQKLTLSLRDK